MTTAKTQSITGITYDTDLRPVFTVSLTEVLSVWRCAASMADREGMTGVADRLRTDADLIERLAQGGGSIVIPGK